MPQRSAQISRKPGGLHGVHHAQDVQARHVRIGTLRVNLLAGVQHIRIIRNRGAAVVYRNQLRRDGLASARNAAAERDGRANPPHHLHQQIARLTVADRQPHPVYGVPRNRLRQKRNCLPRGIAAAAAERFKACDKNRHNASPPPPYHTPQSPVSQYLPRAVKCVII